MKIRRAFLGHNLQGAFISITEISFKDLILMDLIGDNLYGFLSQIHRDWMYNIRWGPVDPEWEFADKSLGSKFLDFTQWTGSGFGAFRREKTLAEIPVTSEWVQEHFPDAGWPWDGSDLDEMHSKAEDSGDVQL